MKLLGFGALVLILSAAPAGASDLRLDFQDGTVTLSARNVPVRQILAEWARKGQTRIVNAERLGGGPVTLELTNMPEGQALDIVLRSAAGYLAAPRPGAVPGASSFDRIVVLATSTPAPATAAAGRPPQAYQAYRPPVMPQPSANVMPGMVDPGVNPVPATPQPGVNDMPDEDQDDTNAMPPTDADDEPEQPEQPPMQIPGMQNGTTPAAGVYVPGAQPPQMSPDASNPLRAFIPPQPQQDPNAQPQDPNAVAPPPQPGPTPFQQGAITTGAPGQVQAPPQQQEQQDQQQQQQNPPQ
jgi:hypothetical protein